MAFINHFQKSRIMLSAFELDIFSLLDQKPMPSDEIAERLGLNPRATDRLMNAVCALGFMKKEAEIFSNTEVGSQLFVKGKPGYMAGLHHTNSLWETWSTLTESVKAGTAVYERPTDINERDPDWLDAFIGAMHYRGMKQADDMIFHVDLGNAKTMLDIGGGSGVFDMAFVRADDSRSATVFDLPNVKPIAERFINEAHMSKRINVISGDYNIDPLPQSYDLILLSAVVHINSWQGNAALIRKCASALNPGGRIVILDHVMEPGRVLPPAGAFFTLNMLVGTKEGDTYTEAEMIDWFVLAGLTFQEKVSTAIGNNFMIAAKN